MLARLRDLFRSTVAGIGTLAEAVVRDDVERSATVIEIEPSQIPARRQVAWSNFFHIVATGHDLDEAARLDIENGAEPVAGYLTLSGRDPPP